jgi:hypothetical protein
MLRFIYSEFSSLRGGMYWWDCRSTYPLPNTSKDAMIIGEIGEYSSFWRLTMVAKFMLKRFGKENPLIAPQESDRYNFCSIPYKIQKHFPPLYQDKPIANVSLITTDIKSKNSSERPVKIHKKIKLKNI